MSTPATKVGDRVELIYSSDEFTMLDAGETGTVDHIDSTGTIFVKWDRGSRLGLIPGEDSWRVLDPPEVIDVDGTTYVRAADE